MEAKITGNDGKARCVRAIRCATATIWKKHRAGCRPGMSPEGYADLTRKIRNCNMRAKNAPCRYARKAARLAAARLSTA